MSKRLTIWPVRDCGRFPIMVHEKLKRATTFRIPLNRPKGARRRQTLIGYTACCAFVLYFKQFGSISKNPKQLS